VFLVPEAVERVRGLIPPTADDKFVVMLVSLVFPDLDVLRDGTA
jgi:hypothetical protein